MPVSTERPHIAQLGDGALLLTFGRGISRTLAATVCSAASRIAGEAIEGITDVVPTYASVGVYFDPTVVAFENVLERVLSSIGLADRDDDTGEADYDGAADARASLRVAPVKGREIVIPVTYDGPDLEHVAEQTRMSVAEVIAKHCSATYFVYMLGFVPGFAYLGDLDPTLVLPRRSEPRRRVPAGSVAIAGAQTAVYPLDSPGGWHILGSTQLTLFDPACEPPALLRQGDIVRFAPVT